MTRTIFNDGWQYRPKVTAFMELGGSSASSWADVFLPHDALIASDRHANVARGETSEVLPWRSVRVQADFPRRVRIAWQPGHP